MDTKALAKSLAKQVSEFGNVVFTDHFVQRLLERGIDLNESSIRRFVEYNREHLCELIYDSYLVGLENKSRIITLNGVRYCYVIGLNTANNGPKVVWTTVYWRK